MNEETRRAGDAYRDELLWQEFEAMNSMEAITLELPKRGPVSYDSIERCAREAGMSIQDWTFDALAAYVRMHEREIHARQAEAFGAPAQDHAPVPAWRARLGEWAYRVGDWLTEPKEG